MANLNLTLSLDEKALRKLEQFAARENKDLGGLVERYSLSLADEMQERSAQSQPAVGAKPSDQAVAKESYSIEILAKSDTLRMVTIAIPSGGCVPWHFHTNVRDTFFCLNQPIVIETKGPESRVELRPGQTFSVAPRQPHRVSSATGDACRFALLQGVGVYDFVPL
jgi:quercetin dioxygenase-like cupin family protein